MTPDEKRLRHRARLVAKRDVAIDGIRALDRASWDSLTDEDVARLRDAFASGRDLCCNAGKQTLAELLPGRPLLQTLVNGWAYEYLACREDSELRSWYLQKFDKMRKMGPPS